MARYSWLFVGIFLALAVSGVARAMHFKLKLGIAGLFLILLSASAYALSPPVSWGIRLWLLFQITLGTVLLLLDLRPPADTSPSKQ